MAARGGVRDVAVFRSMARVALALVTLLASAVVLIDTVEGRKRVDRPSSAAEAQSAPAAADDGEQNSV